MVPEVVRRHAPDSVRRVPRFLYGTAWKEERTQPLPELALRQGFRGIDTANQRRHYHEAAVGRAVAAALAGGLVAREDLETFEFRLDAEEVERIEHVAMR